MAGLLIAALSSLLIGQTPTFGPGTIGAILPTIPQWKTATVATVANGVSGCANANGCFLATWTDGTQHVTSLPAATTLNNLVITPNTAKLWISSFTMYSTVLCTGNSGLNIASIGSGISSVLYGSPAYNVTTASPAFKQLVSPSNGTGQLAADSVGLWMAVATGTIDQTAAGCSFTVDMLTSQYQ